MYQGQDIRFTISTIGFLDLDPKKLGVEGWAIDDIK
jgi:hypothetical protein